MTVNGLAGVIALARNCAGITSLDLTGCSRMGDAAIEEVMKSLLHLAWLSISLCELLTKRTLVSISDWGEGLTQLEMLGSHPKGLMGCVSTEEGYVKLHLTLEVLWQDARPSTDKMSFASRRRLLKERTLWMSRTISTMPCTGEGQRV